jgi:hypothetical protein
MQYASDNNYQYFGLQYINGDKDACECFVSNDFTTASQYGKTSSITGADNKQYGGGMANAIYEITETASYIGCYNDPNGDAMTLVQDNEVSSSTYDSCSGYASSNGYKYFGLQNDSTSTGTVVTKCFVSNDLKNSQKYGKQTPCVKKNGEHFGSFLINALYKITSTDYNSSDMGKVAYIDENTTLLPYPSDNIQLSSEYTHFSHYDSNGNDLPNASVNGATLDQCKTICSSNQDCHGFTMDLSNNVCYPKSSGIYPSSERQPDSSKNLYVRKQMMKTPPMGVSNEIKNIDSVEYSKYSKNGKSVGKAYGIATVSRVQKQKLQQLQSKLDSLAQQMVDLTGIFDENDLLINSQSTVNRKSLDRYLLELEKTREDTSDFHDFNNNDVMVNDSGIVVLQENYQYMFWSILAIAIVIVAMNVVKK